MGRHGEWTQNIVWRAFQQQIKVLYSAQESELWMGKTKPHSLKWKWKRLLSFFVFFWVLDLCLYPIYNLQFTICIDSNVWATLKILFLCLSLIWTLNCIFEKTAFHCIAFSFISYLRLMRLFDITSAWLDFINKTNKRRGKSYESEGVTSSEECLLGLLCYIKTLCWFISSFSQCLISYFLRNICWSAPLLKFLG